MSLSSLHAGDPPGGYFHDYRNEPIGGDNPYWRCVHCKRSDPEINGRLDRHLDSCLYRQAKESGYPYHPDAVGDESLGD